MDDDLEPADEGFPAPKLAVKTIDDLEQLRALSDPLRLRILEALCGPPRTTKQVADRLGEKPTRLYHHVDALEAAGLVHLVHTKPKRGTLEKYYQSVARQFRTDPSIFPRSDESSDDSWQMLGARLLDGSAGDLRRLAELKDPPGSDESEADEDRFVAMIARIQVRATEKTLFSIYERLETLLSELNEIDEGSDEDGNEDSDEVRNFHLMLAFYPDPEDESGSSPRGISPNT